MYNKLVAKVNNIDISGFVLKTKYDTDKSELEKKLVMLAKKFLILVDLSKKNKKNNNNKQTDYNAKITEIENKIPNVSSLAANSVLTAVENKIPDVTN